MSTNILSLLILFSQSAFTNTEYTYFCTGENKEIQCNGTDVIGIDEVIYGRFLPFPCYQSIQPSGTCNGTIEASIYVENQCSSKSSCTLQFSEHFGNCSSEYRPYALVFTTCLSGLDNSQALTENQTCNGSAQTTSLKDNIGLFVGIAVVFIVLLAISSVISYCVGSHRHEKSPTYTDLIIDRKEDNAQYNSINESQKQKNKDESYYTNPRTDENYSYPNIVKYNGVIEKNSGPNSNTKPIVMNEPYYFEPIPD